MGMKWDEFAPILWKETERSPQDVRSVWPDGEVGDRTYGAWLLEASQKYNTFADGLLGSLLDFLDEHRADRSLGVVLYEISMAQMDLIAALQTWLLSLFDYAQELMPDFNFGPAIQFYTDAETHRMDSVLSLQKMFNKEG